MGMVILALVVAVVMAAFAYAIFGALIWGFFLLIIAFFEFLLWLITRPIVWPVELLVRIFRRRKVQPRVSSVMAPQRTMPTDNTHARLDQITRLKTLMDQGSITQDEFQRMKGEVLGSGRQTAHQLPQRTSRTQAEFDRTKAGILE
jgi:uncharacterized membrane protein